jgi:hypothetical protein
MPIFFILDSRVVGFRPNNLAAPLSPLTRQEVFLSKSNRRRLFQDIDQDPEPVPFPLVFAEQ